MAGAFHRLVNRLPASRATAGRASPPSPWATQTWPGTSPIPPEGSRKALRANTHTDKARTRIRCAAQPLRDNGNDESQPAASTAHDADNPSRPTNPLTPDTRSTETKRERLARGGAEEDLCEHRAAYPGELDDECSASWRPNDDGGAAPDCDAR
jgi:hypothetical protein